ncbi:Lrp/AsnC ligand binding domain-containing protein [Psychroflexus sp. CAK57W]|uniref:Lrp/AsnC family transcriptional regulator n=1 Tax=Psychroflexus curvus TaxID=2873595 RepID=UPI001CCD5F75|nr:Lrp/AsnC ligand binding domain-containing protein [Psychroflexus curvus]MBZ9626610.1 Lrp/AsnC ligand binding domain-containing protein [Psychroflexus curvus]MBZ9786377.1 Lrp/AsnC ligand binding domain-containing protein [Psychroflexus curvus]
MIDQTDRKILNILSKDAKASLKQLGSECNMSPTAVHLRLKKLEDQKIITGSKSLIDTYQLGYQTQSFIGIYFNKANIYRTVSKALLEIDEVVECNYTTGNFSLLIKVVCRDNKHLTEVLSNKIQTIDGVARTETFICLEQTFTREIEF